MHPAWGPILDDNAGSIRILFRRKELIRFERVVFQAAKVRNVSRVGSYAFALSTGCVRYSGEAVLLDSGFRSCGYPLRHRARRAGARPGNCGEAVPVRPSDISRLVPDQSGPDWIEHLPEGYLRSAAQSAERGQCQFARPRFSDAYDYFQMLDSTPIGTHADNYFGEPEFTVPPDARRKHIAIFGGTGTGKSTLLANMAASDLVGGTGITVVDPHGGLYDELLSNHIPRHVPVFLEVPLLLKYAAYPVTFSRIRLALCIYPEP
jgi:hypothetical protein